jgi:hypothetical protein
MDPAAASERGRRAVSIGHERSVLRIAPSPFRCSRAIDDDIRAGALIRRPAPIDPEPALAQASQRGASGMGKPAHGVSQLVDGRAALASEEAHDRRDLVILIDAHPRHDWLMAAVEKRLREELAELQVEINEEKSRIVTPIFRAGPPRMTSGAFPRA